MDSRIIFFKFLTIIFYLSAFLFWPEYNFNLLWVLLTFSVADSRYLFILSFSFSRIEILVRSLVFSSNISFKVCFSCSVSEYSLYLSWYIFLGMILAKSFVVSYGFIILTCFRCKLREWVSSSFRSSELICICIPRWPGFADCGLNYHFRTSSC